MHTPGQAPQVLCPEVTTIGLLSSVQSQSPQGPKRKNSAKP